jgi:hypothetical protein
MKIGVHQLLADGRTAPEVFEHGLISMSVEAGILNLTFYTEELEETGFKMFAADRWHSVECVELPTLAVRERIKTRRKEHEDEHSAERHPWGADHGYGQIL